MSKTLNHKVEPYKFEPTLERALVSFSSNRPAFWDRIGHVLEPDALSESPARLAIQAAREIAAETGNGPSSDRQVLQRLRSWKESGRVTEDQIAAVRRLFVDAEDEADTGRWPEEVAITEARKILRPRLEQQALIKGYEEWAHRGDLAPIVEEIIRAGRVGEAEPDGPPIAEPPPWPVLDPIALHGPAGEFVGRISAHTEADPAALLVQFLVAAGALLGRGPWCVAGGARHHANLYAVIVGQTAKSRKGTSYSIVSQVFREVDIETWTQISASGLSSGEGLIHAVRDQRTEMKEDKDTGKWEEVTIDQGVKDKRLVIFEGEFSRPLTASAREGNTLSAVLRAAWDSGDIRNLVRTAAERATNAHVAVVGHITESELARRLSETDQSNGFANRILWSLARRTKLVPDDDGFRVERDLVDLIEQLRDRLGVTERLAAAGTREIGGVAAGREADMTELDVEVARDGAAKALWRGELYPRLVTEGDDPTDPAADVISRAEAQVVRLSLIYAVLDGAKEIGVAHLRAADAVWRYCRDSARRIFTAPRKRDIRAERILEALRASEPAGMGRAAIRRTVFGDHIGATTLADLLAGLLGRRLVWCEERTTTGRPAEVWHATPPPRVESVGSGGSPPPSPPSHASDASHAPPDLVCAWGQAGLTPRVESVQSVESEAAPTTEPPSTARVESVGSVGSPLGPETPPPPPPETP